MTSERCVRRLTRALAPRAHSQKENSLVSSGREITAAVVRENVRHELVLINSYEASTDNAGGVLLPELHKITGSNKAPRLHKFRGERMLHGGHL